MNIKMVAFLVAGLMIAKPAVSDGIVVCTMPDGTKMFGQSQAWCASQAEILTPTIHHPSEAESRAAREQSQSTIQAANRLRAEREDQMERRRQRSRATQAADTARLRSQLAEQEAELRFAQDPRDSYQLRGGEIMSRDGRGFYDTVTGTYSNFTEGGTVDSNGNFRPYR